MVNIGMEGAKKIKRIDLPMAKHGDGHANDRFMAGQVATQDPGSQAVKIDEIKSKRRTFIRSTGNENILGLAITMANASLAKFCHESADLTGQIGSIRAPLG